MTIRNGPLFAVSVVLTALVVAAPDMPTAVEPAGDRGEAAVSVAADTRALAMPSDKITSVPLFIDSTVTKLMDEGHVVGTAVAVVHEGRTVLLRGYGKSGTAVDPSRTIFRIGSVTKPFMAVAALQLVDAGKLDLHRDIRQYLPDLSLRYGATAHQLLTHTAGFGEKFAGGFTASPERLQPLAEYLRRYATQVRRPGRAYSYASANYAVLGGLVETLSGATYEEYLADRIFEPLGMTTTTAYQFDRHIKGDLARGYRWLGSLHEPIPYRFTQTRRAPSVPRPETCGSLCWRCSPTCRSEIVECSRQSRRPRSWLPNTRPIRTSRQPRTRRVIG
jgi:CubicO group peptidase (beta-lactamase class C family)